MKTRVILIVVGGMCSDALRLCGHPYVKELLGTSAANICSGTVSGGSIEDIHSELLKKNCGESIFDVLLKNDKSCALFESGNLLFDCDFKKTFANDREAAGKFSSYIKDEKIDFSLLYLGDVKETGYKYGFMSDEYLKKVYEAFELIKKIRDEFPLRKLMVTSDHGGHENIFTGDVPSDTVIPIIMNRVCNFTERLYCAQIGDISPTVLKMLSADKPDTWEGESLL